MGSLSTTEMPRLDKVIHPSGERINSKCHGYEHRKHMEKNNSVWWGKGERERKGFIFSLLYFDPGMPLYYSPTCLRDYCFCCLF